VSEKAWYHGPSKPRRGHGPWAIHTAYVKSKSTRNEGLMKLAWDKSRRMKNMSGQVDKNLDLIFMMSD
jgi:hypothetical protein